MKILSHISEVAGATQNAYLVRARAHGHKVVGYFCSYVPEEIIAAAGCVPYRMRAVGSTSTAQADVYYSRKNCTVPRHIFDKALRGEFAFLDGLVFLNSCDHTRRMHDNWCHAGLPPEFLHFVVVPHTITPLGLEAYTVQLQRLAEALSGLSGLPLRREALADAIAVHNRKRALLRQINAFLSEPRPRLRGSEMLRIMLATTAMPVHTANELLEQLLVELAVRDPVATPKVRVLLCGGCVEEVEQLEHIERLGAQIVGDYICLGYRAFDQDVSLAPSATLDEHVVAVARRYLQHLSCPRMANDHKRRLAYIADLARRAGADGIVAEKKTFCLLFAGETLLYREQLQRQGIPLLVLEREYGGKATGQLHTRLQAFVEELEGAREARAS